MSTSGPEAPNGPNAAPPESLGVVTRALKEAGVVIEPVLANYADQPDRHNDPDQPFFLQAA